MNWREAAHLNIGDKVKPTKKNSLYENDVGIVMDLRDLPKYDHAYVTIHWTKANKDTRFSTLQLSVMK